MKKLMSLVAAVAILTGLSVAQGAALPVEGSWGMQMSQNGLTFDMTFSIQNNTFTLTNVCTFNGRSATAHVSVPAQYDATTLTILGQAQDQESSNGVDCNVGVQPERLNYVVRGNLLTLTKDGEQEQFTLVRK